MKNKTTYIFLAIVMLLSACNKNKKITGSKEYLQYLSNPNIHPELDLVNNEIAFWNARLDRVNGDLISLVKLGGYWSRRFDLSGNIADLHKSDSLLKKANALEGKTSSGIFRSLAKNCITQHRFKQAKLYIDSALVLGDDKLASVLMAFDIAFELGEYQKSRLILYQIKDKNSFDFLIRKSKITDHLDGNLPEAIYLMEQAYAKVKEEKNVALDCWTLSNLADLYSHNGEFDKAYNYYLKVLAINPQYYHCLKGIAWLAFVKDGDTEGAKKILQYLGSVHPIPDYDIMQYEIADFEKNRTASKKYLSAFQQKVKSKLYGDMYNKYIFYLLADRLHQTEACLKIAKMEVSNRPTYESYNLLVWALFVNGRKEEAKNMANQWLEGKCFEPDAVYHLAVINAYAGNKPAAKIYFESATEGAYELGPFYAKQIEIALDQL